MCTNRLAIFFLAGLLALAPGLVRAASETADEILQAYVDAVGGHEALARIQSRQYRTTISSGLLRMQVESTLVRPDRFEDRSSFLGFETSTGYDGHRGWTRKRGKVEAVEGAALARLLRGHSLDWDQQLNRWYPARQRLSDTEINGVKLRVVEMGAATGEKEIWRFDAATGLLQQIEGFKFEKDEPPLRIVSTFSDYRWVDGVRLTHRMSISDGKRELLIVMAAPTHNRVTEPILAP